MNNNDKELRFEYKGYTAICTPNSKDRDCYYGRVCYPGHPEEPMNDSVFTGDTPKEAEERFKNLVDSIIEHVEFKAKQKAWEQENDVDSIGCVFDIMPDKFLERIEANIFDKNLLTSIKGADYEVPLYYVTKAWDVLLKGTLGSWSFMIGPEEDDDFSEERLDEFIREDGATRTRGQAISDNKRIKAIWKEKFDIDIDALQIDFTQYDKHIPPKASYDTFQSVFFDVPEGIVEWVMGGVNHPNGNCNFDAVSSLMELTAAVVLDRETHCLGHFD